MKRFKWYYNISSQDNGNSWKVSTALSVCNHCGLFDSSNFVELDYFPTRAKALEVIHELCWHPTITQTHTYANADVGKLVTEEFIVEETVTNFADEPPAYQTKYDKQRGITFVNKITEEYLNENVIPVL